MTYDEWKQLVDVELDKIGEMRQDMLPDWLSRDAFDSGMTPREGALECLHNASVEFEQVQDEA